MTDPTLAKPWLTQYPSSIPAEIDVSAYANLAEMLEAALTKYADRVAFHCSGTDMTYRELDRLSTAFAGNSRLCHGASGSCGSGQGTLATARDGLRPL